MNTIYRIVIVHHHTHYLYSYLFFSSIFLFSFQSSDISSFLQGSRIFVEIPFILVLLSTLSRHVLVFFSMRFPTWSPDLMLLWSTVILPSLLLFSSSPNDPKNRLNLKVKLEISSRRRIKCAWIMSIIGLIWMEFLQISWNLVKKMSCQRIGRKKRKWKKKRGGNRGSVYDDGQ